MVLRPAAGMVSALLQAPRGFHWRLCRGIRYQLTASNSAYTQEAFSEVGKIDVDRSRKCVAVCRESMFKAVGCGRLELGIWIP